MSVLVVQHLVTLAEATRIMRFFKQKKHADSGYFFELQDLGGTMKVAMKLSGLEPYGRQGHETVQGRWWQENAYILRVHRQDLAPPAVEEPALPKLENLTPDELRVLKKFAQHLLDIELSGGVVLD